MVTPRPVPPRQVRGRRRLPQRLRLLRGRFLLRDPQPKDQVRGDPPRGGALWGLLPLSVPSRTQTSRFYPKNTSLPWGWVPSTVGTPLSGYPMGDGTPPSPSAPLGLEGAWGSFWAWKGILFYFIFASSGCFWGLAGVEAPSPPPSFCQRFFFVCNK